MDSSLSSDYMFPDSEGDHTREYLWEPVQKLLQSQKRDARIFELGCGNGAFIRHLRSAKISVVGVDPSIQGIELAKQRDPEAQVEVGSGYEQLNEKYGVFDVVFSLEVIGHVYYPRKFARCMFDLTKPGGLIAVSTPYHGYWKNLLIALRGHFDTHVSPLWDHGIIKMWSVDTLTKLFEEIGAKRESVHRLGRIPPLAKTMLLTFRKPA